MKKSIGLLALVVALLVGVATPAQAQSYAKKLDAIVTSANSAFIPTGGSQNTEVFAFSAAGSTSSLPIQMCATAVATTCYTVATITNVAAAGAWYNGPSEPYLYIPATVSAGAVTVYSATNNGPRLQGWKLIGVVPSSLGAVVLTTDVSGALPVVNGGTALTGGTSGGVLGYTGTGTIASSILLTNHAIVLGAGAGATPTPLASLGTADTLLHGASAGPPTYGAVALATQVSGILPAANFAPIVAKLTDGAIASAPGTIVITKGSALGSSTLATPTITAHDGYLLRIVSSTAYAHVITFTTGKVNGITGTTITFTSAGIGDSITLMAYQANWYIVATTGTITIT